MTVKEIIEAYSGVYTVDEPTSAMKVGMDDDTYDSNASSLEVQQIRAASGPFLSTERVENGQRMLNLQNARQVRTFCEHAAESQPIPRKVNVPVCENCKSTMANPHRLTIDPKIAHYEIVLVLLKHLNSPLFQKRLGLLGDLGVESSSYDSSHAGGADAIEFSETQELAGKVRSLSTSDKVEGQGGLEQDSASSNMEGTANFDALNGDLAEDPDSTASGKGDAGQEDEDADPYTESSVDGDIQASDYVKEFSEDLGIEESLMFDRAPELRCEINNWPYHLQEAEKLWPLEERNTYEMWIRLNRDVQNELSKFVDNQLVFHSGQRTWGSDRINSLIQDSQGSPLYLAVLLGLDTWAEALLDNGADINEISGGINIIQASGEQANTHQNANLLRLLLQRGADPYHMEDEYAPALHLWLMKVNTVPVVKAFVDYNVDFDSTSVASWTGLHAFAWKCHDVEAFELIMHPKDPSKKPNINTEDEDGERPLHELFFRRDVPLDMLQAFLAVEGIDVNHDDKNSYQPLALASFWASLAIVKFPLEAKTDVHDQNKIGWIALDAAARGDHVKCIETLLAANSDLDFRDNGGSTPLQHAAFLGRKNAVELLIAKGGDINSTDNRDRTPFFNATRCLHGGQETARFILIELKRCGYTAGEINKVTRGGRTPLRQAAHHGFADVLQELLEYINESRVTDVKATINKGDETLKRTPLHCAAQRGDPRCMNLLVKNGADATLQDIGGSAPLITARELLAERYESSYEEALLLLIEAEQQDATADAELPSIAAASGCLRVLQKLHSLQADLHRTGSYGWTPLAHAKQMGHKEVERFLEHETPRGSIFPSKWVDNDSQYILDDDGLQMIYQKADCICIVSNKPLPPDVERFYYEVAVESLGAPSEMAIGFCTLGASPHVFLGWPSKKEAPFALSWGYRSTTGNYYHSILGGINVDETYGPGDTVGCGVNLETHKIWFTKNGKRLAHEFEGVKGRLLPVLGLKDSVSLRTNFGREPFLWKEEMLVNGLGSS